jgi:hypothetical protein
MLISCWALKGGSGTTVVSVALAALLGKRHQGALVVDLAGDVPAVLGQAAGDSAPGVADWLAAGPSVAPDGWSRLETRVAPHLSLVRRGEGPLDGGERAEVLAGLLAADARPVVADCGVLVPGRRAAVSHVLAASATHSLLVTRPCYLSLRRCAALPLRPSGVVLLREPSRALRAADVASVVGAPVVAQVPVDAAIARAVDCGDLAVSPPRGLVRALRAAA